MLPKLGLFKPILEREGEGGRTVPAQKPDGPPRARSRLGMSPARALTVPPGPARVLTTEPHGRAGPLAKRAAETTGDAPARPPGSRAAREQRGGRRQGRPGGFRSRGKRREWEAGGGTGGAGGGGAGRAGARAGDGRAAAAPRPRWPRRGDPAAVGGGWGRAGAPACGATA